MSYPILGTTELEALATVDHVASFSGGRTSAYMVRCLEHMRAAYGWRVAYVFMDTGLEHPKTYEFIRNVVREWGIPLVCLRLKIDERLGFRNGFDIVDADAIGPDFSPWLQMVRKYGTPTVGMPFCTARMKTEIHKYFCELLYSGGPYTTWIGIRADEPRRLKPKPGIRYLADLSEFDKPDILSWWQKQPFDLGIEEHLGNCVFCVKKGIPRLALAAKDEPELAARFIEMVNDPAVRVLPNKNTPNNVMFRNYHSLESIIAMYSDHDRDELRAAMRFAKAHEPTRACEESCEVFADEDD